MVLRRRHSAQEIASKLRQADKLLQVGKHQAEIARLLGISVMTYHRWRAAARSAEDAPPLMPENVPPEPGGHLGQHARTIHDLEIENARLRQLLVDALLENKVLEEELRQASRL